MNLSDLIALKFTKTPAYPKQAPYDPAEAFPEYERHGTNPDNEVYSAMRELFRDLDLDKERYGTPEWNPFGDFVKPGMTVFVKPNTVVHEHTQGKDIFGVINHASVVRPVLDYICKALKGSGRIILADCQLYMSDFDKAMEVSGIAELLDWYRKQTDIPIENFDLRINKGVRTYLYGRWGRDKVEQDPRGYQFIDLEDKSSFHGIDPKRLRIAIASYKNMQKHHTETKHEYLFPKSLLESDVVITLPKLKTHRRTAITIALKNFMGIPSLKDCLPHFTTGSVSEGGDQYIHPSFRKRIITWLHDQKEANPFIPVKFVLAVVKKLLFESQRVFPFKDPVFEAMWVGNDTVWRTLHDLNRIIMYSDKQGKVQNTQQRTVFSIVDGIVGGEGDGPLETDPVYSGVMLASFNCASIDTVAATLMGFDINKIPLVMKAFTDDIPELPLSNQLLEQLKVKDGENTYSLEELKEKYNLKYTPHPNWVGEIEYWKDDSNNGPSPEASKEQVKKLAGLKAETEC